MSGSRAKALRALAMRTWSTYPEKLREAVPYEDVRRWVFKTFRSLTWRQRHGWMQHHNRALDREMPLILPARAATFLRAQVAAGKKAGLVA